MYILIHTVTKKYKNIHSKIKFGKNYLLKPRIASTPSPSILLYFIQTMIFLQPLD